MKPLSTATILVVDDNQNNLSVLLDALRPHYERVLVARDGLQAIDRAQRSTPDLILLDIMMPPGIDGFETCTRLKAAPGTADIPVIFMTALAAPEDKTRGFQVGAVDYVTKPIQIEEVLARVSTHLTNSLMTRELQNMNAHLDQLVRERTARLDELDRCKTDFISVSAHELRTPLTVIKGYAGVLKSLIPNNQALDGTIAGIITGVDRMTEVVNSMLDVAKIDSDSLELHMAPFNIAEILKRLAVQYADILTARNLSLTTSLLSDPAIVSGDIEHLYKALENVFLNAIKYTPDGGTIILGLVETDNDVEITIQDTGIGIDLQHHELIFEKFYRLGTVALHSTGKTKFGGAGPGLGLTIAQGIVSAHRGRIWASSPGYDAATLPGSTFHLRFPKTLPT